MGIKSGAKAAFDSHKTGGAPVDEKKTVISIPGTVDVAQAKKRAKAPAMEAKKWAWAPNSTLGG